MTRMTFTHLPAELQLKILSCLDAVNLARVAAVSWLFNTLANSDLLWKELCRKRWRTLRHLPFTLHPRVDYTGALLKSLTIAELKQILARRGVPLPRGAVEKRELVGLVEETRPMLSPRGRWTGKWKSSYIVAEKDLKRTSLTLKEVVDLEWVFEFTEGGAQWQPMSDDDSDSDASARRTARVQFRADGFYVNPALRLSGLRWRLTPAGGVQVEEYPPHRVERSVDGGWIMSNGYFCYRSLHNGEPTFNE
ncbi:uncharacterized protein EV422DRAFT_568422 [Fimicolochytrium jonesii]|uniref:uncharacterized protein n=1 Tax=Fimicolochytrium jonesii TaxID=1396493 RepID=UPI0022FE6559|nr:uncharacterized protein EV422DRAFT_568422 [Fimicolochytrium jonesii]KAI8819977.1 hypothetical protein EV422DRAFT_568422 [Fimicolochytrium jonesii]